MVLNDLLRASADFVTDLYQTLLTRPADLQLPLLAMIAAHVVGDFVLQSDEDVDRKARLRPWTFIKHGLIHGLLVYVFLGDWRQWGIPLAVFLLHAAIDVFKELANRLGVFGEGDPWKTMRRKLWMLLVDQSLHLLLLLSILLVFHHFGIMPRPAFGASLYGANWPKLLVVVIGAVLAIWTGGVMVGIVVGPFVQELEGHRGNGEQSPKRGFAKGGKFIGQLERALILMFVLSGQPAGVGFLVTAKSIFRFGDLKEHGERMEAEYIIIGTMASFTWGLLVAWLTQIALESV